MIIHLWWVRFKLTPVIGAPARCDPLSERRLERLPRSRQCRLWRSASWFVLKTTGADGRLMSMPLFLMLPPHSRAVELSSLAVRRRQSRRLPHNPALPFRNSGIVGYSSYSPGSTRIYWAYNRVFWLQWTKGVLGSFLAPAEVWRLVQVGKRHPIHTGWCTTNRNPNG